MPEARAFINPRMQNYHTLKSSLSLSRSAADKFDVLNAHIFNTVVKSGELVIVGDSTASCTSHEAYLMSKAAVVHTGLMRSGRGADEFFVNNFDFLKELLGYSAMGAGVVSDAWSRHLRAVHDTLIEIETLYQRHLSSGRIQMREEFYAKRAVLFSRLDEQLRRLASHGAGLRQQGSVKRALAVSTKSYLHSGEIAGYADKVGQVAKAAKLVSKGAYIGIGLEVASHALAIQQACMVGREDQCRRAKYVHGGSLIGTIGLGSATAQMSGAIAPKVCTALGIASGGSGLLICAVIGGAVGGAMGGAVGSDQGGALGDILYEAINE